MTRLFLEPKTSTSTLLLEFCYTPEADRLDLTIRKMGKILTLIDGPCCALSRPSMRDAPVQAWPCKEPEHKRVKACIHACSSARKKCHLSIIRAKIIPNRRAFRG